MASHQNPTNPPQIIIQWRNRHPQTLSSLFDVGSGAVPREVPPIMRLPGEIRNKVYDYLVTPNHRVLFWLASGTSKVRSGFGFFFDGNRRKPPLHWSIEGDFQSNKTLGINTALLRVSKEGIGREARTYLYSKTKFEIFIGAEEPAYRVLNEDSPIATITQGGIGDSLWEAMPFYFPVFDGLAAIPLRQMQNLVVKVEIADFNRMTGDAVRLVADGLSANEDIEDLDVVMMVTRTTPVELVESLSAFRELARMRITARVKLSQRDFAKPGQTSHLIADCKKDALQRDIDQNCQPTSDSA